MLFLTITEPLGRLLARLLARLDLLPYVIPGRRRERQALEADTGDGWDDVDALASSPEDTAEWFAGLFDYGDPELWVSDCYVPPGLDRVLPDPLLDGDAA